MSDAVNKSREYEFGSPARLVWPVLDVPKKYKGENGKEKGDPKFQATFLLQPEGADLSAIKDICKAIAKEHNADFKNTNWPFKLGDEVAAKLAAKKKNGDYYKNTVVMRTDTGEQFPPQLGIFKDGDPKKGVIPLDSPALAAQYKGWFYSGVSVIPIIQLKWYDGVNEGKPGVKAYLSGVVSLNKGERLGQKSLADRFKGYVGQNTNTDPTGEMDDEIPF
jgi:hypothetical protein